MTKELEALQRLEKNKQWYILANNGNYFVEYEMNCEFIAKQLKEKEKQDKILRIIERKDITLSEVLQFSNYQEYKMGYYNYLEDLEDDEYLLGKLLTETEFNLLKEYFK